MRKLVALFALLCLVGTASPKGGAENALNLFEFNRLSPVVRPFTGATNAIRGIGGAGAPWKIASGNAELKTSGKLEVNVRGLVLVSNGTNPIANFSAILSCQSIDAAGAPSIVNLVAGTAPATAAGDAEIEGTVSLPSPCIAPIVFVAIPATATTPARWLAVSGF
jgi:hypothetical protein